MQPLDTPGAIPVVMSPGRVTQYPGLSYNASTGVLSAPYISSVPYGRGATTTINFGAFPGASDTSLVVTGQTGLRSTSTVNVWLFPKDTVDHSADEHIAETINVYAGNVVEGESFTIYAVNTSQLADPRGNGTRIYGQWTVAYQWN